MVKKWMRRAVLCGVSGVMLATAGLAMAEEGGSENDEFRSRLAERRLQAIERLQRGDTARLTTLAELFVSEEVNVTAAETPDGVTLVLSSDDAEVARRIKEGVQVALARRERAQTRRGETPDRQAERRGRMRADRDEEQIQRMRQERRERIDAMDEVERARMREERLQRFEERLETADPEERERILRRLERMRERRGRRREEE